MYFVLGLVAAGLLALLVTPAIARRSAKRARARLQASLPLNRSEIEAEKDQVRARYALANRRLESTIARLNEQLATRMVESSKNREEMGGLARRQIEQAAAIDGLERRAAELTTTLERSEHRLSAARAELVLREERLIARAAEIQHLKSNIAIRDLLSEEQRLELVERDTVIGNLNDAMARASAAHVDATAKAAAEHAGATAKAAAEHATALNMANAAYAALSLERDDLNRGIERERQNVTLREQANRASDAARAVLETERAERNAELERRVAEIAALRAEVGALRAERTEIAALQSALAALRAENAELRRIAGAEWESDRQDNLRLRERLGEIAVHVARMAETFTAPAAAAEGNGHAVAAKANGHAPAAVNGNGNANGSATGNGGGRTEPLPGRPDARDPRSLAHRLRSIQRTGTRH